MSKFIEINKNLIDIDEIKYVHFENYGSDDIEFFILFKDGTEINLSTNRFGSNSYEHACNNIKGYEIIKEYLLNKNVNI